MFRSIRGFNMDAKRCQGQRVSFVKNFHPDRNVAPQTHGVSRLETSSGAKPSSSALPVLHQRTDAAPLTPLPSPVENQITSEVNGWSQTKIHRSKLSEGSGEDLSDRRRAHAREVGNLFE